MTTKKQNQPLTRMILALIFGTLCAFAVFTYLRPNIFNLSPKAGPGDFMADVISDFEMLKSTNQLHAGFESIREVKLLATTEELKQSFMRKSPKIPQNTNGKFRLEVFVDKADEGYIYVQYDLVELATDNTVWELGRNFPTL